MQFDCVLGQSLHFHFSIIQAFKMSQWWQKSAKLRQSKHLMCCVHSLCSWSLHGHDGAAQFFVAVVKYSLEHAAKTTPRTSSISTCDAACSNNYMRQWWHNFTASAAWSPVQFRHVCQLFCLFLQVLLCAFKNCPFITSSFFSSLKELFSCPTESLPKGGIGVRVVSEQRVILVRVWNLGSISSNQSLEHPHPHPHICIIIDLLALQSLTSWTDCMEKSVSHHWSKSQVCGCIEKTWSFVTRSVKILTHVGIWSGRQVSQSFPWTVKSLEHGAQN